MKRQYLQTFAVLLYILQITYPMVIMHKVRKQSIYSMGLNVFTYNIATVFTLFKIH